MSVEVNNSTLGKNRRNALSPNETPFIRQRSFKSPLLGKRAKRFRLVVMGAASVGKSSIIKRILDRPVTREHKATIEDLYPAEFKVSGYDLSVEFLDTSGSFSFPAMRRLSIITGDAFLIVYSVDNEDSVTEARRLEKEILSELGHQQQTVPIIFIGNKCDLAQEGQRVSIETQRTISALDAAQGRIEVSALDGTNFDRLYNLLMMHGHMFYTDRVPLPPMERSKSWSAPLKKIKKNFFGKSKQAAKKNSCLVS